MKKKNSSEAFLEIHEMFISQVDTGVAVYDKLFNGFHMLDIHRIGFDIVEAFEPNLYFVLSTMEMYLDVADEHKETSSTGEILMYDTALMQVTYSKEKGVQITHGPVGVGWNWTEREAMRFHKIFLKGLRRNSTIPTRYLNAFWYRDNTKE